MVIGDDDLPAQIPGGANAFVRGDAVVDGDQHVRLTALCDLNDFRGQAIAELEAVRYQEVDAPCSERAQALQRDRTAGRTVGIEVGDDEQGPIGPNRVCKQAYRLIDARQQPW